MPKEHDARLELSAGREPLRRDMIMDANHSALANEYRQGWNETAFQKEHTLIDTCPDARLTFTRFLADPKNTSGRNVAIEKIRYIAAAGFTDRFLQVANDPANSEILVAPHFPCGGQGVREKVESGEATMKPYGIGHIVNDRIVSADPYRQALYTAGILSRDVPHKPVFASVTNTETGLVTVFSRFEDGYVTAGINEEAYDKDAPPSELAGIHLTDNLAQKIAFNKVFTEEKGKDMEFRMKQQTQNPQVVTITTDRRPKSLTTPGIEDFTLGLPFNGGKNDQKHVTLEDLYQVLCQAQYPIEHAAQATPVQNFFSTSTLLIETPSLKTSEYLAGTLAQTTWLHEWIHSAPRSMFIGEIKDGVIMQLEAFDLS